MTHHRVFVVQETLIRDPDGVLRPQKDLSAAAKYGELIYLVPARSYRDSSDYYEDMSRALDDFCDDDYLLFIGAPEYIAAAGALAADANDGRYRYIKWDRRNTMYTVESAKLWEGGDDDETSKYSR